MIPTIETDRLALRAITESDLDEWTRIVFADPDVMRYHNKRDLTPRQRAERTKAFHDRSWTSKGYGGLIITDKRSEEILGDCSLDDASETQELELSYSIAKTHWGNGLATEATRALVRFGFEDVGLQRIAGIVSVDNPASGRVLENLGFELEREADLYGFRCHCYALTPTEFDYGDGRYHVVGAAERAGPRFND